MPRLLTTALFGLTAALGALTLTPAEAKAGDYCREYTRTVYIGGRAQEAYGTACLQPDGSWMIVGEGLGNDIPANVSDVNYVIHDRRREIVPNRVVYYERAPQYYRYRPAPVFVWSFNGHHRGNHYTPYRKVRYDNHRWDNHRRWDRDDHRGRGNGHDRGRGRGHGRD